MLLKKIYNRRRDKIYIELDIKCCICLENITQNSLHVLNCEHSFHKKCIFKWMEKYDMEKSYSKYHNIPIEGICPLCRKNSYSIIYGISN